MHAIALLENWTLQVAESNKGSGVRYPADVISAGFRSQLEASLGSSHTEELWYNKTVCLWMTMFVFEFISNIHQNERTNGHIFSHEASPVIGSKYRLYEVFGYYNIFKGSDAKNKMYPREERRRKVAVETVQLLQLPGNLLLKDQICPESNWNFHGTRTFFGEKNQWNLTLSYRMKRKEKNFCLRKCTYYNIFSFRVTLVSFARYKEILVNYSNIIEVMYFPYPITFSISYQQIF